MGFFSWNTSDTDRSISNSFTDKGTFTVHMITEDGRVFTEDEYQGYGEFGGKDIYTLISEMNGLQGNTEDETRSLCFSKIWKRGIEKDGKKYYHGDDFENYETPLKSEGNLTPNALTQYYGWTSFGDSGDFTEWADNGIKVPKLVENLNTSVPIGNNEEWKRYFNSLPYPESCKFQGYFYDDDNDDDDDDDYFDIYED